MPLLLPFSQSWLPEPEANFHGGSVSVTWSKGMLHVVAELQQHRVSTRATAHQQRLWELGDVLELFVQTGGATGYHEYQIAPNGFLLALHYPDSHAVAAVRSGERRLEEYLADIPSGACSTLTADGWKASLSVPATGNPIRLNCGRYDYSSGLPAILSSTSDLRQRDFHRQQDWRELSPVEE